MPHIIIISIVNNLTSCYVVFYCWFHRAVSSVIFGMSRKQVRMSSENKDEDMVTSADSGWAPAKYFCSHVAQHVRPFPPNPTFTFGMSDSYMYHSLLTSFVSSLPLVIFSLNR
jgi:hypothetical protein